MANGTVDSASIVNTHTYKSNPGVSITHIVNGKDLHCSVPNPFKLMHFPRSSR